MYIMAGDNKRKLDWLEDSLKAYNSEDDKKSDGVILNVKELLKKTGVVALNSSRAVYDTVSAGVHVSLGILYSVKAFTYDLIVYTLSADEVSSDKNWNALKEDVNYSKDCASELYNDVGYLASDTVKVAEHSGRAVYHASKATFTGITYIYDAAKETAVFTANTVESLQSKAVRVAVPSVSLI